MRKIIINAPDSLELARLAENLQRIGCSINGTRQGARSNAQTINQRRDLSGWARRQTRRQQ